MCIWSVKYNTPMITILHNTHTHTHTHTHIHKQTHTPTFSKASDTQAVGHGFDPRPDH